MAGISYQVGYTPETRRSPLRFDWGLVGASTLLLIFGLMSLYSVGQGGTETYFRKQIVNIVIGLAPLALFAWVNPDTWRKIGSWLYAGNVLLLAAVLVLGKQTNGAERWLPLPGGIQFQPSEVAKMLTILTLSAFYANRQDALQKLSTFLLGLAHVAVPMFLILKQPHLGAALVILVMWMAVSIVAGIPARFIAAFVLGVSLIAGMVVAVPSFRSQILHSYQVERVLGITNGKKDPHGRDWQTDRAEIAIGVGGVAGAGYLHGEQKAAKFIPEQHNDFILTVIGEEGGLIGCTLLLAAYAFFFYRVFLVMLNTTELSFKMMSAGIFAVLGFHTFVNMAMVLRLLPVVGLWLPFLSSGGTAIWLCMSCVGLLLGIRRRQRPLLFS